MSLPAALILFVFAVSIAACGGSPGPAASPSHVAYRILDEQRSQGYPYIVDLVLVPAGASHADLKAVAKDVVARAKRGTPFSFLWVEFYDYPDFVRAEYAGAPLGSVRYGLPDDSRSGAHGRPSPLPIGDYAHMTYTSFLSRRDWAKRPSQQQVTWAIYHLALVRKAESHGKRPSARRLDRVTARHFGVPASEIAAAVAKVDAWMTFPQGRVW